MKQTPPVADPFPILSPPCHWCELAENVLDGHRLTPAEGLGILRAADEELLDLLVASYRVRHYYFGRRVDLNFLVNAKSGLCGENCSYCAQSCVSTADIPHYKLISPDEILEGARLAAQRKAKTYCTAISGRSPSDVELDVLTDVVRKIKASYPLKLCLSPGLLSLEQAQRLKAAGVDRINHHLNTSRRHYPKICTTHSYDDRLATLRVVHQAGMEICSGGIVGMGEEDTDVVDLALQLAELQVEAVPINFPIPIAGTELQSSQRLNPRYCLKALVLFRLANPRCELRIAGGRELHLGPLQPLGLYPANSIFVGDYLTAKGQSPDEDYRMIEALGFEIGDCD
ncbi:MAG: biotin synthase BioB [Thermoguttaceae bacterium]